jgi:hypothetical protein
LRQPAGWARIAKRSEDNDAVAMFNIDRVAVAESQELTNLGRDHHPAEPVEPAFDT